MATANPRPGMNAAEMRVICVYTRDWRDRDDVRRVLRGLRGLGVSWRLSYKTDEATREGRYGERSTLYISQPGSDDFTETGEAS